MHYCSTSQLEVITVKLVKFSVTCKQATDHWSASRYQLLLLRFVPLKAEGKAKRKIDSTLTLSKLFVSFKQLIDHKATSQMSALSDSTVFFPLSFSLVVSFFLFLLSFYLTMIRVKRKKQTPHYFSVKSFSFSSTISWILFIFILLH